MKLIKKMGCACALLILAVANVQAADMSAEQEWQIKAEIKQLVDRYAMARDNHDAVAYANVFSPNGTLIINGSPYTGRDVLQSRVEAVDPNTLGMHVMSTSQISVIDESHATGIHYATVYGARYPEGHEEGNTVAVPNFSVMGKYHDKYELTSEGWRIAERRFERVFTAAE